MSAFLIIMGFTLSMFGIVFGSHILHKYVKNHADAKMAGFLYMLPGVFLFCLGFYLK